jgi:type VI secretion system secreted protein VgrG
MPSAPIVINSPVAGTTFNLRRLSGREALGRLYQVELELLCDDDRVNLDDLLGQPISVGFEQHGTELRYFHGHAVRFAHAGMEDRRSIYQATLLPWLWFLSRTADCRIFQFMTAPDIIQQVFRELGFTDFELKLSGTYRLREYCVQYRETDFNFVSRLMEEEGIYYYFVHEASKHTLVMTDSLGGHTSVPQYEKVRYLPVAASGRKEDAIFNWSVARKVRTGAFALTDYDFEKPLANLLTAGAESRNHPHASLEVFDYPGDYRVIGDGEAYTKVRLEA